MKKTERAILRALARRALSVALADGVDPLTRRAAGAVAVAFAEADTFSGVRRNLTAHQMDEDVRTAALAIADALVETAATT